MEGKFNDGAVIEDTQKKDVIEKYKDNRHIFVNDMHEILREKTTEESPIISDMDNKEER